MSGCPFQDLVDRSVRFDDLMGPASYDRAGNDVVQGGLYLDVPPWGYHVFEMKVAKGVSDHRGQASSPKGCRIAAGSQSLEPLPSRSASFAADLWVRRAL